MNARTNKPGQVKAAAQHAPSGDYWAQLSVKQAAWALDNSCALVRGFEAMRKVQLNAAHQALAQLQAARERLQRFDSTTEAMSLQTELAQQDGAAALRYWRDLFDIGMKTQQEMAKTMATAFSQQGSDVLGAAVEATRAPTADMNGAFDQWMRRFFSPIETASTAR